MQCDLDVPLISSTCCTKHKEMLGDRYGRCYRLRRARSIHMILWHNICCRYRGLYSQILKLELRYYLYSLGYHDPLYRVKAAKLLLR
jgi:hypothetical protein